MKKVAVIFLLLVLTFAAAGCEIFNDPLQKEVMVDFLKQWYGQYLLRAGIAALPFSAADDEATAVVDASIVIANLIESDRLMAQGQLRQDPELMDEAIRRRPADWTYRSSRAALALQLGDLKTYNTQIGDAQALAADRKLDKVLYSRTVVNDLESVDILLRNGTGFTSREQCTTLYHEMGVRYASLELETNDPVYRHRFDIANERLTACPQR